MKLSTAIRIGSMTTKQIKFQFTDGGNGRCALGAAIDATGNKVSSDIAGFCQAQELFPILKMAADSPTSLAQTVAVWNDMDGLSREEIADRVEKIEQEHDGYLTTGVTESKPLEKIAMEAK